MKKVRLERHELDWMSYYSLVESIAGTLSRVREAKLGAS